MLVQSVENVKVGSRLLQELVVESATLDAAMAIPKEDDHVDNLYNQTHRVLVTYMISDPSIIDRANLLIWAAHNLERMADRVTNICERTIYVATGEMKEMAKSDDEEEVSLVS